MQQTINSRYFFDDCNAICSYVVHRSYTSLTKVDRILVLTFFTGQVLDTQLATENDNRAYLVRLSRLEKAGLIKRVVHTDGNIRESVISLTAKGKKSAYSIIKSTPPAKHPDDVLLSAISRALSEIGVSETGSFWDRPEVRKVLFSSTALLRMRGSKKHDIIACGMITSIFLNFPYFDLHKCFRERIYDENAGGFPFASADIKNAGITSPGCQSDVYFGLVNANTCFCNAPSDFNPYDIIIEHDMCQENIGIITDPDNGKLSSYKKTVLQSRLERNKNMPVLVFTFMERCENMKKSRGASDDSFQALINTPNFETRLIVFEAVSKMYYETLSEDIETASGHVTIGDFNRYLKSSRCPIKYSRHATMVRQFASLCLNCFGEDEILFTMYDKIRIQKNQRKKDEKTIPDKKKELKRIQDVYTAFFNDADYHDFFLKGLSVYCLKSSMYPSFTTSGILGNALFDKLSEHVKKPLFRLDAGVFTAGDTRTTRPAIRSADTVYLFEDISADIGGIFRMHSLMNSGRLPFKPVFLFNRSNYESLPDSVRQMTDEILERFKNYALLSEYTIKNCSVIYSDIIRVNSFLINVNAF